MKSWQVLKEGAENLKSRQIKNKEMKKTLFVLGGNDGEMVLIKTLLNMAGLFTIQPKKNWGVHKYTPTEVGLEARSVVGNFQKYYYQGTSLDQVVFVECFPAIGSWEQSENLRIDIACVDHHSGDSWEAASVMQVLRNYTPEVQISSQLRRMVELAAANDSGYIPAMEALFASAEEIQTVRRADRQAQGVTKMMETEAERAILEAKAIGRLRVVHMSHSKTATVTDRLYGKYDQLLIVSEDGEKNFYGDGALCSLLKEKFPEAPAPWDESQTAKSWNGGSGLGQKGESAFWGGYSDATDVENFIREQLG